MIKEFKDGDWVNRVTNDYRTGWDRIFGGKTDDKEQVDAALKFFKQDCCASGCDCSNKKPE